MEHPGQTGRSLCWWSPGRTETDTTCAPLGKGQSGNCLQSCKIITGPNII